jgi:hypothetical protein
VHPFAANHSDKRKRSAVVVWNVRTSVVNLTVGYKAQAGNHRLLVNVETATSSMQQFHFFLLGCVVGVGSP